MPNPNKYKDKKKYMDDCMHQTRKVEKMPQEQAVAVCLNRWREKDKKSKDASYEDMSKFVPVSPEEVVRSLKSEVFKKVAGILKRDLQKMNTAKKPILFLGGMCSEGNDWRREIKKEYGDKFFILDPYDPDWKPEENIYEELAGITNADYVVFFKGGEGTKRERDFIEITDKPNAEFFDNLKALKEYLDKVSQPTRKKACLSHYVYNMVSNLLLCDLENETIGGFVKQADDMSGKVHREKEKRIVLGSIPEECKKVKPIIIKQGILREAKKDGDVISYARVRMKKDPGKDPQYSLGVKNFKLSQEAETEISKQMFDSFYPDFLDRPQEKKHYKLSNGWEVDIMEDKIVAEYETKPGETPKIPEGWDVIEEKSYKMASYSYSSVQAQIPAHIARKMLEIGKGIPRKELAEDGIEKDSHVTVLYGLHTKDPEELRKFLKGYKPITITLGKTDCFTTSKYNDVVLFKVNSPDLVRLNDQLRNRFQYTTMYPDYRPHATVAYVKKGYGPKYMGRSIPGSTFTVKELTFFDSNDKKTVIKL